MMDEHPYQRRHRWCATASTWVEKAAHVLHYDAGEAKRPEERWLVGYEAAQLARDLLDAVEMVVPLLNDDAEYDLRELRIKAKRIAKALRDRELAPKLAQTQGRTPEEAAAFAGKARELGAVGG